jgi:hypothetical protein
MKAVARIWIAFAAIGAGLLHLAVAAAAPASLMVLLALLGAAELVWAGSTLLLARFPLRPIALTGALLALVLWAGAVLGSRNLGVTVDNLPPLPLASASLLDIVVAVTLAVSLRRGAQPTAPPKEPGAWTMIAGLAVGAVLMVGLTLPGLSQTQAGLAALNGPHAHHTTEYDIPDGGHAGH